MDILAITDFEDIPDNPFTETQDHPLVEVGREVVRLRDCTFHAQHVGDASSNLAALSTLLTSYTRELEDLNESADTDEQLLLHYIVVAAKQHVAAFEKLLKEDSEFEIDLSEFHSKLDNILLHRHRKRRRNSERVGDSVLGPSSSQATNEPGLLDSTDNNRIARRPNHPPWVTKILFTWFHEHQQFPYPTDAEKRTLCTETGLDITQLNNWFINARRRYIRKKDDQFT
ncbi:homeobox KN domain-containing protein [Gaertneriomyces semiglobifer]|nr:homeobox KN domain-containing protein [Gaertneriomyces semiglobifer]